MAIKKSDLYSSLWASCNELRGGITEPDLDAPDNALVAYWQALPSVRATFFDNLRPGYIRPRVEAHLHKMGFRA